MYTLYVIPGSHACRSAMLMLAHKGLAYRRVDLITLLHPVLVRLYGFDAGGETRTAGGRHTFGLRLGDRLGTVPALACGGERVSTNHRIARFLDVRVPEPPLLPDDRAKRAAVEEVENWANGTLQMAARRILVAALARDPEAFGRSAGDGRLGYLLYKRELPRRLILPRVLGGVFNATPRADSELVGELPGMLDRIDAWIEDGIIGGSELNAADFMVAPSLALILYRPDLKPVFEGRPSLQLVDRLLPEPETMRRAPA
jgi:glutathione S-transferase